MVVGDFNDDGVGQHGAQKQSGDALRQLHGESRVHNDDVRDHGGVVQALLEVVVVIYNDCGLGRLGAGSGSGRDSDEKGWLLGDLTAAQLIILGAAAVDGEHTDSLCSIDNAAAAESERTVAALCEEHVSAVVYDMEIRFTAAYFIAVKVDACIPEQAADDLIPLVVHTVGNEHDFLLAVPFEQLRQFTELALTKNNLSVSDHFKSHN